VGERVDVHLQIVRDDQDRADVSSPVGIGGDHRDR
jgi:hypothetical protein